MNPPTPMTMESRNPWVIRLRPASAHAAEAPPAWLSINNPAPAAPCRTARGIHTNSVGGAAPLCRRRAKRVPAKTLTASSTPMKHPSEATHWPSARKTGWRMSRVRKTTSSAAEAEGAAANRGTAVSRNPAMKHPMYAPVWRAA